MAHRIDIELTSRNGDVWTWRAAGARQPKGSVADGLLYAGAKVGDVVRAEIERELDGARLVAVVPPKATDKPRAEVLEVIGRTQVDGPAVNVQLAERARGRRDGGPRRERSGERGDRPDRGDGARRDRPERPRTERAPLGERGPRPAGDAARRERPAARPDRGGNERHGGGAGAGAGARQRPTAKRLAPGRAHRNALLDTLPVEQRPVAEQLFRGGIPAVRQAIIDQNAALRAAGHPEVPAAPLLAMADELLPRTKQADWLDHASAALKVSDDISLRDLRAVVVQADTVARDEESREMASKLRAALTARVEGVRTAWSGEIAGALDEGKVVRAVRLAARLPDPSAKLDAGIQQRLLEATNAGLSADVAPDRWLALLEAAEEAPFRRDVQPAGVPADAGEAVLAAAAQASNRIPALLKLLGLAIPPPPRPRAAAPTAPAPRRPIPPPTRPVNAGAPAAAAAPVATAEVTPVTAAEVTPVTGAEVTPVAAVDAATVPAPAAAAVHEAPANGAAPTADAVAAPTAVASADPTVAADQGPAEAAAADESAG